MAAVEGCLLLHLGGFNPPSFSSHLQSRTGGGLMEEICNLGAAEIFSLHNARSATSPPHSNNDAIS